MISEQPHSIRDEGVYIPRGWTFWVGWNSIFDQQLRKHAEDVDFWETSPTYIIIRQRFLT